ncbi:DNA polymerase-like protein [Glossina pallidipes salivary gland hypertrophy virus]|uniref:DNA polymerase n=1 Tax=Glossina hytrovirus (isolate Glossina pallidipes/Ethiopia/Seibersdorf/-) TaxID=379529 RepID=B0YLN3_GHVS|nr:DNA polymerase-like protein [Glossina pallidipes salivary gland hypertrophy virus]ABQ08852.1 DNA polymerase-like protein [Glossina pallidipes salivary gland hypertrophy virus]
MPNDNADDDDDAQPDIYSDIYQIHDTKLQVFGHDLELNISCVNSLGKKHLFNINHGIFTDVFIESFSNNDFNIINDYFIQHKNIDLNDITMRNVILEYHTQLIPFTKTQIPMWRLRIYKKYLEDIEYCSKNMNRRVFCNSQFDDTILMIQRNIGIFFKFNRFINDDKPYTRSYDNNNVCVYSDVFYDSITKPKIEIKKFFPYKLMSIDIEVYNPNPDSFPDASREECKIIIIACAYLETKTTDIFYTLVPQWDFMTDPSAEYKRNYIRCKNEVHLLIQFANSINYNNVDIMTGYNMKNFDLMYIYNRMKLLGLLRHTVNWNMQKKQLYISKCQKYSNQQGTRDSINTNIFGFVIIDMFEYISSNFKLRSYKLNDVVGVFLRHGEKKLDIDYKNISVFHDRGSKEDCHHLLDYCAVDAELCNSLLINRSTYSNVFAVAHICHIPIRYVIDRGQQIRIYSMMCEYIWRQDIYTIPLVTGRRVQSKYNYEGARVIEPKKGFYNTAIATLDFASLYPSIMIGYNMCYTTLIQGITTPPGHVDSINLVKYNGLNCRIVPGTSRVAFVDCSEREGILPSILKVLLQSRAEVRKKMKTITDKDELALMDSMQLGFKLCANSAYGYMAASTSKLPCIDISSSVTCIGRFLLTAIETICKEKFKKDVIYGDTDSVMVDTKLISVHEALSLGKEMAKICTELLNLPSLKLEFEKVYMPYLLICKKRYIGAHWTKPEMYDKIDTKGVETARRDNCKLLQIILKIIIHDSMNNGLDKVFEKIENELLPFSELWKSYLNDNCFKLDKQDKTKITSEIIEKFIMSKKYTKMDYVSIQPHVSIIKRLSNRQFNHGERIEYVIASKVLILTDKKQPDKLLSDMAFLPEEVLEKNLYIHIPYYINGQVLVPALRFIEPMGHKYVIIFISLLKRLFPRMNLTTYKKYNNVINDNKSTVFIDQKITKFFTNK